MAYTALKQMQKLNREMYGLEGTVYVPQSPAVHTEMGRSALAFLRENCQDLKFDETKRKLSDNDGKSSGENMIPYNMERDLDRLCLENAVGRFLDTGSKEDAFDVYFCYCEIFQPFGNSYASTRTMIEMLSEHEENASSLLMKHRDHYSHSVYVFLLGLAFYRKNQAIRKAYHKKYNSEGRMNDHQTACHFLEYWGLASLFHDVGYPFEIAQQQIKSYVCKMSGFPNDFKHSYVPYVSYQGMEQEGSGDEPKLSGLSRYGTEDLNRLYGEAIYERYHGIAAYKDNVEVETLYGVLQARPTECINMDHAYFSGMILARKYMEYNQVTAEEIPSEVMDAYTAIILHNSLFKFDVRGRGGRPLELGDGQPLTYLLMLCDELQCWDRASYGQNSRTELFTFGYDMEFDEEGVTFLYYYDQSYSRRILEAKAYRKMERGEFLQNLEEIVALAPLAPRLQTQIVPKKKHTRRYLSTTSFLNLYDFALALNGRYLNLADLANVKDEEVIKQMEEAYTHLSLEYKLANIAQAKGFAGHLERIDCFYTDRAVDYEKLVNFTEDELVEISKAEHIRWCNHQITMGWSYGIEHVLRLDGGTMDKHQAKIMRERTRKHDDMIDYSELSNEEIAKDAEPLKLLAGLVNVFRGLSIYRIQ